MVWFFKKKKKKKWCGMMNDVDGGDVGPLSPWESGKAFHISHT